MQNKKFVECVIFARQMTWCALILYFSWDVLWEGSYWATMLVGWS